MHGLTDYCQSSGLGICLRVPGDYKVAAREKALYCILSAIKQ